MLNTVTSWLHRIQPHCPLFMNMNPTLLNFCSTRPFQEPQNSTSGVHDYQPTLYYTRR